MPIAKTKPTDAISLLKADHREVEKLFKEYEHAREAEDHIDKLEVARKVCSALLVHMEVEENIFYPAVRKATGEEDLLNEAIVEHGGAKELIVQLGKLKPEDPMFDARIKVLSEQIGHHVEEEEGELFPKVAKSRLDLDELGKELADAETKIRVRYTK